MILPLVALCLLPSLGTATPPAPDEVRLRDGRVLVGRVVRQDEHLLIKTRDGNVRVASADVAGIRTDAELRAALQSLDGKRPPNAFGSLQMAGVARSYGLDREMWRYLDECVAQVGDGRSTAVGRRLAAFLVGLEGELLPASRRQAEPVIKARALLRGVRSSQRAGRHAAILEILTRLTGIDDELRRRVLIEPGAEQRLTALRALVRRDRTNLRLAERRAVQDKDAGLRNAAAELVRDAGEAAGAVRRLIPGLLDDRPLVRKRTAEAYANMGDPAAIPVLVRAGPYAGVPRRSSSNGPGTRAHMFATTTRSFIRDFDVEIAQAAAVANPVIGNVREGVVLDVRVAAVVTQRVQIAASYRRALAHLAGSDPGRDPARWAAWLAARQQDAERRQR